MSSAFPTAAELRSQKKVEGTDFTKHEIETAERLIANHFKYKQKGTADAVQVSTNFDDAIAACAEFLLDRNGFTVTEVKLQATGLGESARFLYYTY